MIYQYPHNFSPNALSIRFQATSSASGSTLVSPTTLRKLASATQRGGMWMRPAPLCHLQPVEFNPVGADLG